MRLIIAVFFGLIASANAAYGAAVPEVYSENAALSREATFSSSTRVREPVDQLGGLTPFVQVGNEYSEGAGRAVDTASHDYIGGGLLRRLGALTLWGETRHRNFYGPASDFQRLSPVWDQRLGLAAGNYLLLHSGSDLFDNWFAENYGEAVFTSADGDNVISDGYSRLGIQWTYAHQPLVSAYAEPYLDLDRVGHYYDNQFGVKGSLRLQGQFKGMGGTVSASFAVSRLAMKYIGRSAAEANALAHEHYGFEVLGVIGSWI